MFPVFDLAFLMCYRIGFCFRIRQASVQGFSLVHLPRYAYGLNDWFM